MPTDCSAGARFGRSGRATAQVVGADRLISLVLLPRRHSRLSATVPSREPEVSTRAMLRDFEALSAVGVPVQRLVAYGRARITFLLDHQVIERAALERDRPALIAADKPQHHIRVLLDRAGVGCRTSRASRSNSLPPWKARRCCR